MIEHEESFIDGDTPPTDLQTIRRWIGDAKRDERNRIHQGLLAEIEPEIRLHRIPGSQTEIECVMVSTLRTILDRLCSQSVARPPS